MVARFEMQHHKCGTLLLDLKCEVALGLLQNLNNLEMVNSKMCLAYKIQQKSTVTSLSSSMSLINV